MDLMSEKEKLEAELLAQLRKSANELAIAKSNRKEAVIAALEAGIPRVKIAEALGLHRNSIYRILES